MILLCPHHQTFFHYRAETEGSYRLENVPPGRYISRKWWLTDLLSGTAAVSEAKAIDITAGPLPVCRIYDSADECSSSAYSLPSIPASLLIG